MITDHSFSQQMNEYGLRGIPFLFIIDFEMKKPLVFPLDGIDPEAILYNVSGNTNQTEIKGKSGPSHFKKSPVSFPSYQEKFQKVIRQIRAGNSYLLNLTCPTPIETDLDLKDIFIHSNAPYKLWYRNQFVVFSPEIFIQIKENTISSFPMKGTIDAALPDAATIILNDLKETAEHNTIVDLIRNDLSIVASGVKVGKFRYLDEVKTCGKNLLQVSSRITGTIRPEFKCRLGDLLLSLLPAGSVSGAPKKKTVEIILATEEYQRNYYTGVFGIFDGKNLDSAVMIRYIENTPTGQVYKSGGGITSFSDPLMEYNEMVDKIYLPF
jgi:para-aminobenzoate synthetase component I